MDAIYKVGDEMPVGSFVVYGKTADKKLYNEATYETLVESSRIELLFEKGMLTVFDGTLCLRPVSYNPTTGKVITVTGTSVAGTEWQAKLPE